MFLKIFSEVSDMKRVLAFTVLVAMLVSAFAVNVFSAGNDSDETLLHAESAAQQMNSEQQQQSNAKGMLVTAVSVFRCVEYVGRSIKAIDAVVASCQNGDSVGQTCMKAIDAFLGRKSESTEPGEDASKKQYQALVGEIRSIHEKIDGLEQDLEKINNSIADLANTIIAENQKEYINDFRKEYVNLSNDMLEEYDQLLIYLNKNESNIDNVKYSYDDLYVAATALNSTLFAYMTGNYREDGLAIQDVMYDYVYASESLTQAEKFERCINFTENLYATYALSQYCLLICRLYQMEYCNYYGLTEYVTQNKAPESLPYEYIVQQFQPMNDHYEQIVTLTAQYIVDKGNYDMEMLYVPSARPEVYSIRYSELRRELYFGDTYYYRSSFPEKYMYIFGEDGLTFFCTDETAALLQPNGEIQVVDGEPRSFGVLMKYRENVIANYGFTTRDRVLSGGYGVAGAPYLIGSMQDLTMAQKHNPASSYKLIADIYANATVSDSCFPYFRGTFDGNGYTISNVTIKEAGSNRLGLFGEISGGAVVKNLTLQNVIVELDAQNGNLQEIGTVAGRNYGTVYNCSVEGSQVRFKNASSYYYSPYQKTIGGVVGYNSGRIENCQCLEFRYQSYSSITRYNDFMGKRYFLSIGGLVGDVGGGMLKNNLVVHPYIYVGELVFYDYLDTDYPYNQYFRLSCGLLIGTRNASSSEALVVSGTTHGNAHAELAFITTTVGQAIGFNRYTGADARSIASEQRAQYRLMQNDPTRIDRDVYACVSVAHKPTTIKMAYGQPLDLMGIQLRLTYENGMASLVPITAVTGYDPEKSGIQTVMLSYKAGNGEVLSVAIDVEVECLHDWVFDQMIEEPTHMTEGKARNLCTLCGAESLTTVEKTAEHVYGDWQKHNEDMHIRYCECEHSQTAEHQWDEGHVIVPPTHTESGETIYACVYCSESKIVSVPPYDQHVFGEWVTKKEATCESSGERTRVCLDPACTYAESKIIPILPHVPGDWILVTEATCSQNGEECRTCLSGCGQVLEVRRIPKLAHEVIQHEGKTPSCNQGGWEAYETCQNCDYTTYEELPALGHDTIAHDAKAPTCTQIGWNAYETCGREGCDYTTYEELPALGHEYEATTIAPSCTEKGYMTYVCHCGDAYVADEIDALGHSYSDWVIVQEATATDCGVREKTCVTCKDKITESIPATGEQNTLGGSETDSVESTTDHETVTDTAPASSCETVVNVGAILAMLTLGVYVAIKKKKE